MPRTAASLTMRDVARAAGVAVGTVSNVLNDLPTVSRENREKVLQAIEEIGYVRNESARQLKSGKSGTIGLVLIDALNPYYAEVAIGAEAAAAEAGYTVFMGNANASPQREAAYLAVLEQNRVDGIVLACAQVTDELADQIARIQRRGTPVVIVGHHFPTPVFNSVTSDNFAGGEIAMSHLLDLGHQNVAFVSGPLDLEGFADRLAGARQALTRHRLPQAAIEVVELDSNTVAAGAQAAGTLLDRTSDLPTAIFAGNDLLALGALQAAVTRRLRVPEDVAIIGFDDISFAAGAAVPLSSVRQPTKTMGRQAFSMLIRAIAQQRNTEQLVLEPTLVVRTSTAGPQTQ